MLSTYCEARQEHYLLNLLRPLPENCLPASYIDLSGGPAGLIRINNNIGESAVISLYGAQVLSWQSADGQEHLYCSPMLPTQPGPAIRGGVPVCFPQFSERGPLPKHGLARTCVWQLEPSPADDATSPASVRLWLSDNDATRALWPHPFLLQLEIELGAGSLSMALNVTNTGTSHFNFSAALHTYLATADVRLVRIAGLQDIRYIDTAKQQNPATQSEVLLRISEETDRIYLSPPATLRLQQDGQPPLQVTQQGFTDSVVWNPGPLKAEQLGDMPGADWPRMLCIEAAQIADPVHLAPQATWRGVQQLSLLS